MPQERYFNYGATSSSTSENRVHYSLHNSGVYRGMELAPNSAGDRVTIGEGCCLMPDGVLCRETTSTNLVFSLPSVAINYTVVATHVYRELLGGDPVTYSLESGLLPVDDSSLADESIVLGWIRYPGGAIPLDASHLQDAPKQLEAPGAPEIYAPVELVAPIQRSAVASIGPDLTFNPVKFDAGTFTVYQEVVSSPTAVGSQTAIQQIQLYTKNSVRPESISLYNFINAPVTTKIDVEVYGTDQVSVPVTNGTIVGTASWQSSTATVDRTAGTFDDGKPYTVRVTYTLDPGKTIWVGRLVVNFWPYP